MSDHKFEMLLFKSLDETYSPLQKEAKCQIAGVPDNVRIITDDPNNQVRRGQKLRFACRHRGHFLRGKAVVECLADEQWSAPFPTCGGTLLLSR